MIIYEITSGKLVLMCSECRQMIAWLMNLHTMLSVSAGHIQFKD